MDIQAAGKWRNLSVRALVSGFAPAVPGPVLSAIGRARSHVFLSFRCRGIADGLFLSSKEPRVSPFVGYLSAKSLVGASAWLDLHENEPKFSDLNRRRSAAFPRPFLGTFFPEEMALCFLLPPVRTNRYHDLVARTFIGFVHLKTDSSQRRNKHCHLAGKP